MWASAMLYPPDTPEEVKKSRVQMLLRIGRDRAGAIEYVKNAKRTLALQADLPQMGVRHLSTSLFLVLTIPVIADPMPQGRHFVQDCRI